MRGSRVEPVLKSKSAIYLRRAANLLRAADAAFSDGNYDGTALNAIHSIVSLSDAITVSALGLRSAAQDHLAAVGLLARAGAPERLLSQVREAISKKSTVEYEARDTSRTDAESLLMRARRAFTLAEPMLK